MIKQLTAVLFVLGTLTMSSCYNSSEGVNFKNDNKAPSNEMPLARVAEIARSFGYKVPANEDMVSLMKLPTDKDGKYYAWQLAVTIKSDDIRSVDVDEKGAEDIILSRIDTNPKSFERYSHLTTARGDLRATVYTSSGSREQRVIAHGDSGYQKALQDFEAQKMFWTSRERDIKAKFPDGASRQAFGVPLELK